MATAPNDEIDLVGIIANAVRFAVSNFWTIMVGTIAAMLVALLIYSQLPKIYESKMIILSDILTETYSESINESIGALIHEDNVPALSSRLGLTPEEASKVRRITVQSIKKDKDSKDNSSTFGVSVEITDRTVLPKLQSGLIHYLRSNEFVKIRVDQRKDFYQSMVDKVGLEIRSLDSLKNRLFSGQQVAMKGEMMLVDPANVYTKILELYKEQINYRHALELVDSIQLIEGFTEFEKPVKPRLFVMLMGGFLGGLFISYGFLGLRRILELIKQ